MIHLLPVNTLIEHQRTHPGERHCECKVCGFHYHQGIYRGERLYKPGECRTSFSQIHHLSSHRKIHLGEIYECSGGGKCFIDSSSLHCHQRVHTGERHHVCSECRISFISKCSLFVHQRGHIAEEPYECPKHGWLWLWRSLMLSSSVQSLSRVRLFATLWTSARQASLSITNSWSPTKPMSIESVMPPNHLILCRPLLLLPSIFPSIRVFSNESALYIRWPKYWSFSFNISPSNEHPGLISFRMDWFLEGAKNLCIRWTLSREEEQRHSITCLWSRRSWHNGYGCGIQCCLVQDLGSLVISLLCCPSPPPSLGTERTPPS